MVASLWRLLDSPLPPLAFREQVRLLYPRAQGDWLAQVLWQRGLRDPADLAPFLFAEHYVETGPEAFGEPMAQAVERIWQAIDVGEAIALWGDFDADGVTATAVLLEGLGALMSAAQLSWTIPDRQHENHGLNRPGLDRLAAAGVRLVITADNGCGNPAELDYARELGLEVIVTDHHLVPSEPLMAIAVINPRCLAAEHPLAHLSGVAVAYKLVEAVYAARPQWSQLPLETLLDLVAVGLVADLVELRGDCRQLVRRGLKQLASPQLAQRRPGLAALLQLCRRQGDRPSDISFGLGPRINAVSRIRGDVSPLLDLLTTQDPRRGEELALQVEELNQQRQRLQKTLQRQAERQIQRLNLHHQPVIVLADVGWPVGLLGPVAGQLAQAYRRPVILLSRDPDRPGQTPLARGSARSATGIDLYDLLGSQRELLTGFGGHPAAAGLSLPVANLDLLRVGLNAHLGRAPQVVPEPVDLEVSLADLGEALFRELQGLEPCGRGNPAPRLRVSGVRARAVSRFDPRRSAQRQAVSLQLTQPGTGVSFPALWWDHKPDEVPQGPLQVVLELDYRSWQDRSGRLQGKVQARILDLQLEPDTARDCSDPVPWQDGRGLTAIASAPVSWDQLTRDWGREPDRLRELAFHPPDPAGDAPFWPLWLGVLRGLARAAAPVPLAAIAHRLDLAEETCLQLLRLSSPLGYRWEQPSGTTLHLIWPGWETLDVASPELEQLARVCEAYRAECRLRQRYFASQPLADLQRVLAETRPELAQSTLAKMAENP